MKCNNLKKYLPGCETVGKEGLLVNRLYQQHKEESRNSGDNFKSEGTGLR